jgi:hypothetical protein
MARDPRETGNWVGHDSFLPDAGVLITKTKNADLAPFMWIVDSHPDDIAQVDYIRPDGSPKMYSLGDYRQLADATFKVGTKGTHPELGEVGLASAGETTNTYVDRGNDLKFLILDRIEDRAGVLKYRVAVMKATPSPRVLYGVEVGGLAADAPEGGLLTFALPVTNTGSAIDVMRVTAEVEGTDVMIPTTSSSSHPARRRT